MRERWGLEVSHPSQNARRMEHPVVVSKSPVPKCEGPGAPSATNGEKRGRVEAGTKGAAGPRGLPPLAKCAKDGAPRFLGGSRVGHPAIPGPQKRGTEGTLGL